MCRHLGWLGEPVSIASLVLDPPCGLLMQSYAPRIRPDVDGVLPTVTTLQIPV